MISTLLDKFISHELITLLSFLIKLVKTQIKHTNLWWLSISPLEWPFSRLVGVSIQKPLTQCKRDEENTIWMYKVSRKKPKILILVLETYWSTVTSGETKDVTFLIRNPLKCQRIGNDIFFWVSGWCHWVSKGMWLRDCEKSCAHSLVFHHKQELSSSENRTLLSHNSQGLETWALDRQRGVCRRARWQISMLPHPKLLVVRQHSLATQTTLTTNFILPGIFVCLAISKFPFF